MTRTVLLGDICDIKIGRTPPRKQPQWFSESHGIKWASIKDMGNTGKYISQTSEFLTADAIKKFNIPIIPAGTLLMSFKLTVGRLGFTEYDMCSNEAIAQLPIKDPDIVDKNYLYYYLKNFNFGSLSSTSSIATAVNSKTVKNISINLPPLDQQKKITNILGSLDEKIELNRRMNETLEQLGQALFRHYFVDKTKQNNGNIQTIPLGKKFHPKRGRGLQARDMICGDTPVISGGLKPAGFHNEANTTAPVITISASGANAGFVSVWGEPVWSADSSYIDSTTIKYVYTYYLFLKNKQKEIYDMQTGSGQPHIYPKHIELLEIADLSDCEFNDFEQRVRPLFDMIHENKKQIDYLSNIRDLLLPKLISGGIEI